jgi:MFS family permease
MRPSLRRWLAPVPACVLQQIVFGSFYATGVFASRIRSPALTYALGVGAWFLAVAIALAGFALHSHAADRRSPARALSAVGAILLAAQALFPPSLRTEQPNVPLLYLAAVAQGTGYGILYVVSICVLQAWVPESPGTATGGVIFAGGVGTLVFVAFETVLIQKLGSTDDAMTYAALLQTALGLLAAVFISMPPSNWHPKMEHAADPEEAEPLLMLDMPHVSEQSHQHAHVANGLHERGIGHNNRLSAKQILLHPAFYVLLAVTTAGVGPGYGVILHGSRMQTVLLGLPHYRADRRFFFITLVGVCARLVTGIAVDMIAAYKLKNPKPFDSEEVNEHDAMFDSAKDVTAALLFLQFVVLALIFPIIRSGAANLFALSLTLIYISFSGISVVSVCLCRFTFGPENSTLAFSLVCFAIGLGDFSFSSLVAYCAQKGAALGGSTIAVHLHDYDLFYIVSLAMSALGFPMVYALKSPKPQSR